MGVAAHTRPGVGSGRQVNRAVHAGVLLGLRELGKMS